MTQFPRRHYSILVAVFLLTTSITCLARGARAASRNEEGGRPARLSFIEGTVSFWRAGAEDWVRARLNTPLAPGDHVYASRGSRFEIQIGAEAFARVGEETDLILESLEPDFVQFRFATGVVSLDLRSLDADTVVELDTAHAAFTIRQPGYYRADVGEVSTAFLARQSGRAEAVVEAGERWVVRPDEQLVIDPETSPPVRNYEAPEPDEWDSWNSERTNTIAAAESSRYVPRGVYGGEVLDQYGRWNDESDYGRVWYPAAVERDWAPYTTGDWVYDPGYGWTWIDQSPWGWAPFHYGRWVYVGERWGWAPGPVIARPYYAPAVVGFLSGPRVSIGFSIGAPIGWVALGWGEPIIPWWGYRGFIGQPCWRGWGGPRVVNNVVINNYNVVNVNRVVFANTRVRGAMVSVPHDRFGHGDVSQARLSNDGRHFRPVRGALPVRAQARSLVPQGSPDDRRVPVPSRQTLERPTVARHPSADPRQRLIASGVRPAKQQEVARRAVVPRKVSDQISEGGSPVPADSTANRRDQVGRGSRNGRPDRERSVPNTNTGVAAGVAAPESGEGSASTVPRASNVPPRVVRDANGSPQGQQPTDRMDRNVRQSARSRAGAAEPAASSVGPGGATTSRDAARAVPEGRSTRPLRPDRSVPPPLPQVPPADGIGATQSDTASRRSMPEGRDGRTSGTRSSEPRRPSQDLPRPERLDQTSEPEVPEPGVPREAPRAVREPRSHEQVPPRPQERTRHELPRRYEAPAPRGAEPMQVPREPPAALDSYPQAVPRVPAPDYRESDSRSQRSAPIERMRPIRDPQTERPQREVQPDYSAPPPRMERVAPHPQVERPQRVAPPEYSAPAPRMEQFAPRPIERPAPMPRMERPQPAPQMQPAAPAPQQERPAPRHGTQGGDHGRPER